MAIISVPSVVPLATLCLLLITGVADVKASLGDRLNFFQDCLFECSTFYSCHDPKQLARFQEAQGPLMLFLGWDCDEECKYNCKWETINWLLSEEVAISAEEVPQFHGKVTNRDPNCRLLKPAFLNTSSRSISGPSFASWASKSPLRRSSPSLT